MRQIQFTRKAIKDLQKLQPQDCLKIPERLLIKLANTGEGRNFTHTKHLSGHFGLWRSRIDVGGGISLRLIWTENKPENSILFLYVDARDDDTYSIDLNKLPYEPAYSWDREVGIEWSLFVNGQYKTSPILTQNQRKTSDKIGSQNKYTAYGANKHIGFFAHITQSPPGTGKTITAALRACKLYDEGWNIVFLLPQNLWEEVKTLRYIKSLPSDLSQGFFHGTFYRWIVEFCPEVANLSLSPQAELEILQDLARRAENSRSNLDFGNIEQRDLVLYQSFVINSNFNRHKNQVYQDNLERVKQLQHIKPKWWNREFKRLQKFPRSDIANLLENKWSNDSVDIPTQNRFGTVLIVDESQDYLVSELNAIKALCLSWHRSHHLTHLWLLGDLNQRIMPVDFDWGALELVSAEEPNWKCFRNSSNVLKFSNLFLAPVRELARQHKTRSPYRPTDPDCSYEAGERVKLLIYPSLSDAESFLERLSEDLGSKLGEVEKSRSLIYKLASRVKILQSEVYESQYSDCLEFLNVHQVKGREFDACIVFNVLGASKQQPTSEDWWQWYTLLTRTRSRLLVIATQEQYNLLKQHIPDFIWECDRIERPTSRSVDSLIKWIQEESNDLDLSSQEINLVKRYIGDALQKQDRPLIYWDTYEVLDRTNIGGKERSDLETEMILSLKKYDRQTLKSELKQSQLEGVNPLIHSLILRALDRHWDATECLEVLQQDNPAEYQRAIEAIALDLESNNFIVEAARVRFQKLNIPYPDRFPLPEIAKVKGDLVVALKDILKSRFPN